MSSSTEELSGFGLAGRSASVVRSMTAAELPDVLTTAGDRGSIARGLGRAYGDPATNGGGQVVRLAGATAVSIDAASRSVTAGAGVSLDELLRILVPAGWFVPVTPGTRFVTVGGAVASDIHGKNHHVDGSFGTHVTRLRMMLADGSIVEVGPDRDPTLFWATVGGMGLTGIILDVTFRVFPIETSRVVVDTYRLPDLDSVMTRMVETESTARYSVAWIDLMARGRHLGRGVLTNGDHASREQFTGGRGDPLAYGPRRPVGLPPVVPTRGVINRASVAAFNEFWFRSAPIGRSEELQEIAAYFHPLDAVDGWNRVYGRRGFVQYQFVVPDSEVDVLCRIVERFSASRLPIFLVVLKRFGPGNPAPLSFPMSGWQLAVDVGAAHDILPTLLREFDELVLEAGGRHYLAKDFHADPSVVRRGYPQLDAWLAVRRRVDPNGVWQSDMSRRLGLTP
ncbi:MAG: FAD-binding protein [Ilumatobacteraceae bacterium]